MESVEKKLELKNISVLVNKKKILENLNIEIKKNEIVVLMGPNGTGKSTISNVIMGNPKYEVISGEVILDNEKINDLGTEERAKKGLFLSFQNPLEISGLTMLNFLRTSYNSIKNENLSVGDFNKILKEKMEFLEMDSKFRTRFVNSGFSGGEKKRSEILQMLLFEPEFAILDEIDSGLDVDALKLVCRNILKIKEEKNTGILIITHYNKILEYLKPNRVLVLKNGKIEREGDIKLAEEILEKGF